MKIYLYKMYNLMFYVFKMLFSKNLFGLLFNVVLKCGSNVATVKSFSFIVLIIFNLTLFDVCIFDYFSLFLMNASGNDSGEGDNGVTPAPTTSSEVTTTVPATVASSVNIQDDPQYKAMVKRVAELEALQQQKDTPAEDADEIFVTSKDLGVIEDCNTLYSLAESKFKHVTELNSRNVYPDTNFSHFKVPTIREKAKELSKVVTCYWKLTSHLYLEYLKLLSNIILSNVNPIDPTMITEIQHRVQSVSIVQSSPFFNLQPYANNIQAMALYGASHGMYDLLAYRESNFDSVTFTYNFSQALNDQNERNFVKVLLTKDGQQSADIEYPISDRAYRSNTTTNKYTIDDHTSMYSQDNYYSIYSDMYNISSSCSVEFAQSAIIERKVFVSHGTNATSYESGSQIRIVINDKVEYIYISKYILDMIIALLHIDTLDRKGDGIKYYCNYIGTMVSEYFKQQPYDKNVDIVRMNFEITISRVVNDDQALHAMYRSYVNDGRIVPITVMQYAYYLKMSTIVSKSWLKYSLYSALSNVRACDIFLSVLPRTTILDKENFKTYMKQKQQLTSDFYVTKAGLPLQDEKFHITVEQFMEELMVRTSLKDDIPEYFPALTCGRIFSEGTVDGKSRFITTATSHSILCKLSMHNYVTTLTTFVEDITLLSATPDCPGGRRDTVTIPKYVKMQTSLVKSVPTSLKMFTIGMEDIVLEENDSLEGVTIAPAIVNNSRVSLTSTSNQNKTKFNDIKKSNFHSWSSAGIKSYYLNKRLSNPRTMFKEDFVDVVDKTYAQYPSSYHNHSVLYSDNPPTTIFNDKGSADTISIQLWNEIMPSDINVTRLDRIKLKAGDFIKRMDLIYPSGIGMNEIELTQYVTANSSSSFIGIQQPSKSTFALDSMKSTLKSHCDPIIIEKPWLIPNLDQALGSYVTTLTPNDFRSYADMCLNAKASSSSIPGEGSFRDYVFTHSFVDVIAEAVYGNQVPLFIYVGTRSDRRGKYRLICSFDARFRIIDYYINNISYDLCSHNGPLSKYTTEGYNNEQMWDALASMAVRPDGFDMICIDYKGYDTQLSLKEYVLLGKFLNCVRINNDPEFQRIFEWYERWMRQPKPLVRRVGAGYEVLIEYYRTLASGLHGTHSYENLIGISTYLQAKKLGIITSGFWSNGDDQNIIVKSSDVDKFIEFINKYFSISWDKSLIGHVLAVWGKLWFAEHYHPMWEIGTFRSIWEKEGGETSFVDPSKILANYCKIIQVAICLIRLGKDRSTIKHWINKLCMECNPPIDPNRIPHKLQLLEPIETRNVTSKRDPKGLDSVKDDLVSRTFDLISLGSNNYYDMLRSMYELNQFYTLDMKEVTYYPIGTVLYFESGFDYGADASSDLPWALTSLAQSYNMTDEQLLIRSILQSTKSYDGPVFYSKGFSNMYELAVTINERNKTIWTEKTSRSPIVDV